MRVDDVVRVVVWSDVETMSNGKVMSTSFKTSRLYKYQPISASVLVQCYVDHFRVDTHSDRLFVTTRGEPMKQGMINKGQQLTGTF